MQMRNLLLAATVLAAPAAAFAQPVDGLYVGGGLGYNYLQEQKIKSLTIPGVASVPGGSSKFRSDGGFVGLASVGYGFGNGFRVEIEGSYRTTRQNLRRGGTTSGHAEDQTYGGFLNGFFDFDVGSPYIFPYLGVGVGYQQSDKRGFRFSDSATGLSSSFNDNSQGGLAAQGIAGAAFPIPGAPGLSVTAEYRFMAVVDELDYKGKLFGTGGPGIPISAKLDHQYNHAGLLGVRYAFNAAPPPPPAAPVPEAAPAAQPARTYLVFFDWDRADLTARARQIIAEAAQNVTRVQVTRIEVSGHADLSGTPKYNQGLSLRRANNVAAELVRLGVARSQIDIMAFGDSRPLVQTARGVREPQNRRVEIVLK